MPIETFTIRTKQIALWSGGTSLVLAPLLILLSASMHMGVDPVLVLLVMILTWLSLAVFTIAGIGYFASRLYRRIKEKDY